MAANGNHAAGKETMPDFMEKKPVSDRRFFILINQLFNAIRILGNKCVHIGGIHTPAGSSS